MSSILYYLIIYPIEFIVDLVFTLMHMLLGNPGLSIVAVSVVINFLILPMYKRSDALQEKERDNQARMAHWTGHIRKTFRGDERFMMLSEYYRQNNYRPIYALKGSISLLLQIPFFIAAYHYLSNLTLLTGASFLNITDLSRPDALLKLGGISVNILPILMTLINFISGAIYTKGFPLKDKIQLYAMALVFLVLLYGSPAGLVLYWTCNNIFSLLKNIYFKILHPFLLRILSRREKKEKAKHPAKTNPLPSSPALFFGSCAVITLLTGILIPSSVVVSSPSEFLPGYAYETPLRFLVSSVAIAAGLFIVWNGVLYFLKDEKHRKKSERLMWVISGISLTDYLFFGKGLGNLSPMLNFDFLPYFTPKEQLINIGVLLLVVLVFLFFWFRLRKAVPVIMAALVITIVSLSGINISRTQSQLADVKRVKSMNKDDGQTDSVIHLSKNGKNVVVLMLDRAISGYLPYIMDEKPELKEAFSGFTYYPNTMSYGMHTIFASPCLFGGYEYTPVAMNSRSSETLNKKVNEALRVMPKLFSDTGYNVTVCDPPYAGYQEASPDLSIYSDIPRVRAYNLKGKYSDEDSHTVLSESLLEKGKKQNFFRYSIFKILPVSLQPAFYDGSYYLSSDTSQSDGSRISDFLKSYSVLCRLQKLTKIDDGDQNTFLMMDNETTHEPCPLQLPDYELKAHVDNSPYIDSWKNSFVRDGKTNVHMDTTTQQGHYFINMASYLQLENWLNYLKKEGVYDNTRIIIVSDHGFTLGQFDSMLIGNEFPDAEGYNPVLMVKDFNAGDSPVKTSNTFMTNADVPTLAVKDLIQDPVNPFTKQVLNNAEKNKEPQMLNTSEHFYLKQQMGTIFNTSDGKWYSVHDNIFDRDDWKLIDKK